VRVVERRDLDVARGLVGVAGDAVQERRVLAEEARVHGEIRGVFARPGACFDKLDCAMPRLLDLLRDWTGYDATDGA